MSTFPGVEAIKASDNLISVVGILNGNFYFMHSLVPQLSISEEPGDCQFSAGHVIKILINHHSLLVS
ncbi:hypothetical protein BSR03_01530 [Serratia proteamaculans]|nr:hypothetical protein BSR03_01530 [Serratia proteamaculans]